MAQHLQRWAMIEALLRGVLSSAGGTMSLVDRAFVEEWLDHNELGLAAERLLEVLPACPEDLKAALRLLNIDTPDQM